MGLKGGNRDLVSESGPRSDGVWRTTLGGRGRRLTDVFADLERSSRVERLVRHTMRDIVAARVTLTPEEGEGYWELTRIRDDVYVVVMNYRYNNQRSELVPGEGLIEFTFEMSGDMNVAEPLLRFARPALLVWAQSPGVNIDAWNSPRSHVRMVAISVRPEFLIEHCLTSSLDMPPPLRDLVSKSTRGLGYYQLPLTSDMFAVATKLINGQLNGKLGLLYTEALTLELLCSAVGSFYSLTAVLPEEYTERTLRCLEAVRTLLMRQFAPAPKLRDLARSVGMAETALTRGFKTIYRETIFDFSIRCRMQHALKLLRDEHWSVERVSEAVGYHHPTSFATAFRRHCGMRPVDVRLSMLDPSRAGSRR